MIADRNLKPGGILSDIPLDECIVKLKRYIVKMAGVVGGGYVGQCLGSAEMIACLFSRKLRLDPINLKNPERDRFLLSAGHYALSIYAVLAMLNIYDKFHLAEYGTDGSILEVIGSDVTPGIEIGGGSLGLGLSRGVGHALSAKLRNKLWDVYVYMSNSEFQEGQVWEAAMTASRYKLDNLLLVADYNRMQSSADGNRSLPIDDIAGKLETFGWNVSSINGNNVDEITSALGNIKKNNKPTIIISNTIIGYGVSFLQNRKDIHYIKWSEKDLNRALEELA